MKFKDCSKPLTACAAKKAHAACAGVLLRMQVSLTGFCAALSRRGHNRQKLSHCPNSSMSHHLCISGEFGTAFGINAYAMHLLRCTKKPGRKPQAGMETLGQFVALIDQHRLQHPTSPACSHTYTNKYTLLLLLKDQYLLRHLTDIRHPRKQLQNRKQLRQMMTAPRQ